MATTIDELDIEIKASATEAAKGIDALVESLKKLSGAFSGVDGLKEVTEPLEKLSNAIGQLSSSKSLVQLANALSKLAGVKIESTLLDGVSQLVERCKTLDEATVARWERLAAALSSVGSVKAPDGSGSPENTDDDAEDSGTDKGTQNTGAPGGNTGSSLQQKIQALSTLGDAAKNAVGGIGKALLTPIKLAGKFTSLIGKGLLAPLKAVGNTVSKVVDGFKNFARQVSQVVVYSALYKVISMITDGLQEGIDNLYQYSDALNGRFAASMDSIATSAQYLGNSVAAMASPIFNALAPVLDTLVNQFVELINMVNMFFASLTGASTTTVAKKSLDTYADSADNASSAVSELEKTILGFDEINKLNDNSSGSGSGSGSGADYSSMFEEVAIDNEIADFAEQLKAAINAGDWEGAGTLLGEKVNSVVDSIDWDGIGSKVGYAINGVISTAYWTLETIDFEGIGSGIATSINSALEQIDASKVGAIIARWFTILPEFLIGVIETLDFGQIAEKISSFITGYLNEFTDWLDGVDWTAFGTTLITSLGDFIAGIDFSGIAASFTSLLSSALSAALETIGLDQTAERVSKIGESISSAFELNDEKESLENIGSYISETFLPVLDELDTGLSKILDAVTPLAQKFIEWATSEETVEAATSLLTTAIELLSAGIVTVIGWITSIITWLADLVTWLTSGSTSAEVLKAAVIGLATAFATLTIITTISSLIAALPTLISAVTAAFTAFNAVLLANPIALVISAIAGLVAAIIYLWNNCDEFRTGVTEIWEGIKSTAIGLFSALEEKVTEIWESIKTAITTPIETAKSTVKSAIEKIKGFFNFSWSLPKLKLPHISIDGEFSLSPLKVPTFSIDWYKTGGIMDGATLFGMANGKLLGGGEAGAEAILPLENHNEWMDTLVDKMSNAGNGQDAARQIALMSQMVQLLSELLDKDTTVEVTADSIAKAMKRTNQRAGKTVFAVNT